MARSVRLRPWQKSALELFTASSEPNFLAVATPGAGKTTLALTAARHYLAEDPSARLVVVVPTAHLKFQWTTAALNLDLHLEPGWTAAGGRLPADMHGIVTTYSQVALNAELLARISSGAFVILDEVHHAADDRSWGDAIRAAFTGAARRLALSGTPFRSDTQAIPFVRYDDDAAVPDFEYGYGDALADRAVVRPIYFPRINGEMEWTAPDGTYNSAAFDDPLDQVRAGQRLRTALSLSGQWLPEVLGAAHRKLKEIRTIHPDAGGLVIAMDQEHARGIAELLANRFGVRATLATSDDPMASARIAHFARSSDPWIVAVRMVSEGVDIPRLRVGVFATNTTTDLFFRQAIGRLVRHTRGLRRQKSFMFIPDDSRLRIKAAEVAVQRRHSLRKKSEEDGEAEGEIDLRQVEEQEEREQAPSLFAPISAVAVGDPEVTLDDEDEAETDEGEDPGYTVELAPPPPLAGGHGSDTVTRAEHKSELRALNAARVRELVALTGRSHASVNGELNRLAGIRRITEATAAQLQTRLAQADRWLGRLTSSGKAI